MGHALIAYLDTHAAVWLAEGTLGKFSDTALTVLRQSDLLISPMVVMQLESFYDSGLISLPSRDVLLKMECEAGVRVCDLAFSQIAIVAISEKWTRNPFDRVIVAHAKANGWAALVSADETIAKHYARTVW